MGGGLENDHFPPSYVRERCKFVGEISSIDDYVIFSSIFTLNVPQKYDFDGYVISEAKETYNYYKQISRLNKQKCFLENSSFDTIGSVYFSIKMIEELELPVKQISFVTSNFHAVRTRFLVKKITKLLEFVTPVNVLTPIQEVKVINKNRENHEIEQLQNMRTLFTKFETKHSFINWLYTQHDNYSTTFKSKRKNAAYLY